jgi:uracil-DNA glycosylase
LPRLDASKYTLFTCPHPSPMFVNRAPGNRARILEILKQVRKASLS